jgi:HSP20 family protein
MALERWRPRLGGLTRRVPEVEDVFDRFFRDWPWPRATGEVRGGWAPDIDMMDRPNEILVRADLPGLEQKDIHVTVDNGVLTIRGERKGEQETKDEDYYCCERWAGSFVRSLSLPAGTDPNRIDATFKNGVLEIHVPKTREATGRRIEIKAA